MTASEGLFESLRFLVALVAAFIIVRIGFWIRGRLERIRGGTNAPAERRAPSLIGAMILAIALALPVYRLLVWLAPAKPNETYSRVLFEGIALPPQDAALILQRVAHLPADPGTSSDAAAFMNERFLAAEIGANFDARIEIAHGDREGSRLLLVLGTNPRTASRMRLEAVRILEVLAIAIEWRAALELLMPDESDAMFAYGARMADQCLSTASARIDDSALQNFYQGAISALESLAAQTETESRRRAIRDLKSLAPERYR